MRGTALASGYLSATGGPRPSGAATLPVVPLLGPQNGGTAVRVNDYARSTLTFRIDTLIKPPVTASHEPPFSLNNARIALESACWITDARDGRTYRFVHGASCKTERVGLERDIWMQPNADFIPVASDERILAMKTYARQGESIPLWPPGSGTQMERQETTLADAYADFRVDMAEVDGEVLATPQAIINAVLAGDRLIARTTVSHGSYTAVIEYPIKTINANERDWIYQTDTGPHLFPDLTRAPDQLLSGMELAFSAFNVPEWIEFIVRVPTEIADGAARVWHYSKSVRMDARNEVVRIP